MALTKKAFRSLDRFFVSACVALCVPGVAGVASKPVLANDANTQAGEAVRVVEVAGGLQTPWALAFLPDGRMLVSERSGRLRVVSTDGELSDPVSGVPRAGRAVCWMWC